ncbi:MULTISPECIES: HlyD family type I secretion periplasmic adaptor subunit [Corallincola]|uniref:Membrane fusion protein (MFP) family protein n=2 Tax=Corallincola TaxID=1775176 RepID=A0ABY1WSU8_9GAMM|nr:MULTISPECIES: HlyD family type I secretion periplasmic adaptor subunit [Corallincola]TAA47809.1 HlyD family type I secretion periplasmic adaptor subunit [Corallincola spongiicola]TCI02048.1 HlyD family type I secretion periplasmic adaptor subunit [Corallincola luteus]
MQQSPLRQRVWPAYEFADAVESPAEQRLIRNIIFIVSGAILLIATWSIFTSIEEVAKAKGQVVPLGHRQIIQSQLGGTLATINVEEGDVVKKGDVLANFLAIDSQSAVEELESKQANLTLQIERYNAFIERREMNVSNYATTYPSLVSQQIKAFGHMQAEFNASVALAETGLAKTQAELDAIKSELPALRDQISASTKTLAMMNSLSGQKAVSQVQILDAQQKTDSYLRELKAMEGKELVLAKNLANDRQQLKQKQAALFTEVSEKRADAQAELLAVRARLKSSGQQVAQTTVLSPVNGVIQSIPSTSSGSVVAPGGTVAVIVPTTPTALLEAKLSPRDIGFVTVGQTARIKVDAFDYSRYGALDGVVKKISPTTDADEHGGVFYKVQIAIEKPYFRDNPEQFGLIPGMTAEADIVTGEKTVFQYLWKPIFTNISSAFGER